MAPGLGARDARVTLCCHGMFTTERPNVTPTSRLACKNHLAKQADEWGGPGRGFVDDKERDGPRPKQSALVPTAPFSEQGQSEG